MSQPALSELKQRIGFEGGKVGSWRWFSEKIGRRLATKLYTTWSFDTSMILGGVL